MSAERSISGRRRVHLPCLLALAFSLAACGGSSSSPRAGVASTPASDPPTSQASPPPAATSGHCAITPDATAAATIKWNLHVEGRNPRIKAGQAVAFVTTSNERPTVTEGVKGTAVANPCIDQVLSPTASLVVTFAKPGVYNIFCRKDPRTMYTAVYVL
jgi:plastocyanin